MKRQDCRCAGFQWASYVGTLRGRRRRYSRVEIQYLHRCRRDSTYGWRVGGGRAIPITPKVNGELSTNLRLMHKAGVLGTPGILYKDAKGDVHLKVGMPTKSELPTITSLPPQTKTVLRSP
jgi:hypothetical protein